MKKIYLFLLALLGLHLLILTKFQFTAWPEMFSFPFMVNSGLGIYRDFHHAYQPLLTIVLSFVYQLFGYKLLTLQIFTWGLVLFSDILIFAISLRIFGKKLASLIPVLIFVSLQPFFEGNMLWFDLATVPLILSSIYFLFGKKLFLSGLTLSLAILTKQQVALFIPVYFVYFWLTKVKPRTFLNFSIGGIIPVAITFLILFSKGVFSDYLFWTFTFPLKYLPKIPGYVMWPTVKQILVLAILTSPLLLFFQKKYRKPEAMFLGILFLVSIVTAFPRFSYFHLQPMLAIYSAFFGTIFVSQRRFFLLAIPLLVFLYIFKQNLIFLNLPPRFYDKSSQDLATIVRSEVKENEKVYLLGPNSLIYVLSGKLPPKPWIENYVWHFEIPGMQEKMLKGWKDNPPAVIFWSDPINGNWFDVGVYQPKEISDWIRKNYVIEREVEPGVWMWRMK